MAKVSPLLAAPPLIFAGLALVFFLGVSREDPDSPQSAREGQGAPALRLEALGEGAPFTDEDLATPGVKLVNFWASWCAPCRAEHPNLELLAEEGVPILGINYKDEPDKALAFLQELGDPYAKLGADPQARTAFEWGVRGIPETFVINGAGEIVLHFFGPITQRSLEGQIRPAIEAAR